MNALEAVIQYLKRSGLSTRQIASKVNWGGDGWESQSLAIVCRMDGGDPNLYEVMRRVRIEVRTFAAEESACMGLMDEVENACRKAERVIQAVTGGTALIYWINPDSGRSVLYDEDQQMNFTLLFFEAAIGMEPIS